MLTLLGLLSASALPLGIDGATDCPRPQEVAAHLRDIAPLRGRSGRAWLISSGGRLQVRLHGPDAALINERTFEAGPSCAELAEAAALVLASWLADLAAVEVDAPPAAVIDPVPAPATGVVGNAREGQAPASQGPLLDRWQLGVGFVTSGLTDPVPGVALSASGQRGRWSLTAEGTFTGEHQAPLGPGQIQWAHRPLAVTAQRRLAGWRQLQVEGGAGIAGALLVARGVGFDVDHQTRSLDLGPLLALRLGTRAGSLTPFLGLTTALWLRGRTLEIQPDRTRRALPRLDAWLVLGLAWRGEGTVVD